MHLQEQHTVGKDNPELHWETQYLGHTLIWRQCAHLCNIIVKEVSFRLQAFNCTRSKNEIVRLNSLGLVPSKLWNQYSNLKKYTSNRKFTPYWLRQRRRIWERQMFQDQAEEWPKRTWKDPNCCWDYPGHRWWHLKNND